MALSPANVAIRVLQEEVEGLPAAEASIDVLLDLIRHDGGLLRVLADQVEILARFLCEVVGRLLGRHFVFVLLACLYEH